MTERVSQEQSSQVREVGMFRKRLKSIIVLCDLGVGGERGRVMSRGGTSTAMTGTEYKDPMKVVKKMDKKCIEIGKIDKQGYELANRVYHRGGQPYDQNC